MPAVIRCSQIPLSVLLELVDLNNSADRARLRDPEFREHLARSFVNALLAYYGTSLADETASLSTPTPNAQSAP